jgi:hypothetical protein
MQPSVGLPPPLQNAADPPVAKRRRDGANATDFPYWSINLAKLLIRRRVATISPHAAIAALARAVPRSQADGQKRRSGPDQNGRADEPDTIGITTISTIAIRNPLTLTSLVTTVPGAPRPRANASNSNRTMASSTQKYGDTRKSRVSGYTTRMIPTAAPTTAMKARKR